MLHETLLNQSRQPTPSSTLGQCGHNRSCAAALYLSLMSPEFRLTRMDLLEVPATEAGENFMEQFLGSAVPEEKRPLPFHLKLLMCVGVFLLCACRSTSYPEQRLAGLWTYESPGAWPRVVTSLLLSSNGMASVMGGDGKIGLALPCTYRIVGETVLLNHRDQNGICSVGILTYRRRFDTLEWTSDSPMVLRRDSDDGRRELLATILGASSESEARQRLLQSLYPEGSED